MLIKELDVVVLLESCTAQHFETGEEIQVQKRKVPNGKKPLLNPRFPV